MTYLKDNKYYEDLYDKMTIDIGQRETDSLLRARELFYNKAKTKSKTEISKMEFWWNGSTGGLSSYHICCRAGKKEIPLSARGYHVIVR